METTEFIRKLQAGFKDQYPEEMLIPLAKQLKFYKGDVLQLAYEDLIISWASLPKAKNVLASCNKQREKLPKSIYDTKRFNSYTAKDFGVTTETYTSWFASLQLKEEKQILWVATTKKNDKGKPMLFPEDYIMNNLRENLLKPFPSAKKVIWYYGDDFPKSEYNV